MVLNGPTVGVDIGAKYDIHAVIRNLAKAGLAVIIISDDLPEVLSTCNRVLIMSKGKIVGEVDTKQTDEQHLEELSMQE